MKVLIVYARLYADCLQKTFAGIVKNAWTLFLPVGLELALMFAGGLLGPLGIAGGFIVGLLSSALLGSYIYFVGEIVSHAKVNLSEFRRSIGVYFWSVINLFFVLWIVEIVLGMGVKNPQTMTYAKLAIRFLVFVLMPSLEVISLRGMSGGVATLQRAFDFLQEHWIEWFAPNAVIGAAAYLLLTSPLMALDNLVQVVLTAIVLGALLHVAMVFRGNLFNALDGSSHRQRMFKYRNQQS